MPKFSTSKFSKFNIINFHDKADLELRLALRDVDFDLARCSNLLKLVFFNQTGVCLRPSASGSDFSAPVPSYAGNKLIFSVIFVVHIHSGSYSGKVWFGKCR
jgi:hypothetical protein